MTRRYLVVQVEIDVARLKRGRNGAHIAMIDAELRHTLMLARSGATQLAWQRLHSASPDVLAGNPSALTLKGRLLKDQARALSGRKRETLFAAAGEAYAAAAKLRPTDSYPLINAAAMAVFAGAADRASTLAAEALALIDQGLDQGETPYWREATRAEALLLLGETAQSRAGLATAIENAPLAWEDRAATLRQFALILEHRGEDSSWLDALRAPPVLHFSGTLAIAPDDAETAKSISEAVSRLAPGSAYGALAAGADILIAEAVLAGGAELHVVLPCATETFRALSVVPSGGDWTPRFDRLIAEAVSVECCFDANALTGASVRQADAVAMGLAVERASQIECQQYSLQIVRLGANRSGDIWRNAGRPLVELEIDTSDNEGSAQALDDGVIRFHLAQGEPESPRISIHDNFCSAIAEWEGGAGAAIACSLDLNSALGAAEAEALHKHALSGAVIASRNVALAALADASCKHVEPLGELALAAGAVPVYALVGLKPLQA